MRAITLYDVTVFMFAFSGIIIGCIILTYNILNEKLNRLLNSDKRQ